MSQLKQYLTTSEYSINSDRNKAKPNVLFQIQLRWPCELGSWSSNKSSVCQTHCCGYYN